MQEMKLNAKAASSEWKKLSADVPWPFFKTSH